MTLIAYLTSVYPRPSDTFVRNEVRELRRLGCDVRTYAVRPPPSDHLVSEEIRQESANTYYLLGRGVTALLAPTARIALRAPRRFVRALGLALSTNGAGVYRKLLAVAYLLEAAALAERLIKTDAEQLHNQIAATSSVAMLASELSGLPWSMTVHGGGGELDDPHVLGLDEKVARATFSVTISAWTRSQLMRWSNPEDWSRIHVVRCGVDPSFLVEELQPLPTSPRICTVGRLADEKGQLVLVQALARLREEGIDGELVIIGDGPMRNRLEAAVRDLGLGSRVTFVGWAGSDAVRRTMLDARAVVLPSFAEGIPVTLMESMALGRPVVATYVGGIPELVQSGPSGNGWLVPAGSVDALAAALREVLADDLSDLAERGKRGRQRVALLHDLRAEVRRLAALLDGRVVLPPDGSVRSDEAVVEAQR